MTIRILSCVLAACFLVVAPASAEPASFETLVAEAKAAMQTDPRAAIAKAKEADGYASATTDARDKAVMHATAQWLTGEALLRMDEGTAAVPLIDTALETVKKVQPGSILEGDLLLSMGGIATDQGQVAKALLDYQAAHRIYRDNQETRSQAKALISIAMLYYGANDWQAALKYYREALDAYTADPGLAVSIHNGRGNALRELGRGAQARAEFDAAIALARRMKSPLLTATIWNNAARLSLGSGDLAKADHAIAESFRESGVGTPPEFRRQQLALAAQAALQHRDPAKAAGLLSDVFRGVDLTKTTLADRDAHRTAYQTFKALHQDDLALAHLAALKRLDDDATNLARSTSAALMGARFDFANQALKIANLKAEDAQKSAVYERARAKSQRLIFFGTAGATLIIIAMLLYALRTSRRARARVQAAADDLAVTNGALGKALAAKTEFLATTSHEIRTPLNGILGMTQVMLIDDTIGVATRDRLKVVHEAGVTMRALVDDILDVAKMETGNLTIEDAVFDLKVMMNDATRLWSAQAEAKRLDFVRMLDECPGAIRGDAARVRQIVFNLVSNALKFTASGAVTLTVAASGADRYRIDVRDSGIGIAADKFDEIFESFRQADTSTTRQFGGTGLGLSICRNLARAMGGDVSVVSTPGEGATFTVDLPLVRAEPVEAPVGQARDLVDLLIVDRNPITRNMLKALFAPHMPTIELAGSIDEAVARLGTGDVVRVLADDATIRAGDPLADLVRLAQASDAGVAVLWPVSAEVERDELLATGIDLVIAKPISGAALAERLTAAFASRHDSVLVSRAA